MSFRSEKNGPKKEGLLPQGGLWAQGGLVGIEREEQNATHNVFYLSSRSSK